MEFPTVPPTGWLSAFKPEVENAIAPVVARVTTLETHINEVQTDMTGMKGKVAELQRRQLQLENGACSEKLDHVPTYIDIKGFCAYDNRDTEGVPHAQASEVLTKLKATLNPEAQATLGVPRMPLTKKNLRLRPRGLYFQ